MSLEVVVVQGASDAVKASQGVEKLQTPNSKLQRSSNNQVSIGSINGGQCGVQTGIVKLDPADF